MLSLVKRNLHISALTTDKHTGVSGKPMLRDDVDAQKMKELAHVIDTIPALPSHINDLVSGLFNDETDADTLADVVSSDPAIVCNILKTVNSTYFGLAKKTENLRFAIVYLGFNMVRKIALKTSFSQTFQADWSYGEFTTRDLWEHSYLVSSCIESLVTSDDNEYLGTITTLGLLHDIGKYVLFRLTVDREKKRGGHTRKGIAVDPLSLSTLSSFEREEALFSINHAILGSLLAEKWGLSERICTVLEYHHHPSYWPPEEIPDSFVKDVSFVCLSDLIVNTIITKKTVLHEPPEEYFRIAGLEPSLENIIDDSLLMDLARARMFTALIS